MVQERYCLQDFGPAHWHDWLESRNEGDRVKSRRCTAQLTRIHKEENEEKKKEREEKEKAEQT
jgi:hypothetical protein